MRYYFRILDEKGNGTDEVVEQNLSMFDVTEVVCLPDGRKARRDFALNLPRMFAKPDNVIQGRRGKPAYPYHSDAMGCHPKQIPEMQAFLKSRGTHADYSPDGRLKVESHSHREKVRKALRLADLS